jgi:hypothetical protein
LEQTGIRKGCPLSRITAITAATEADIVGKRVAGKEISSVGTGTIVVKYLMDQSKTTTSWRQYWSPEH